MSEAPAARTKTRVVRPTRAVGLIFDALGAAGWRVIGSPSFVGDLVEQIVVDGGEPQPKKLARMVPRVFITQNETTRAEVEAVLTRALARVRVVTEG